MKAEALMEKFAAKCPFAVLTQVAIRGLLRDDLNEVFEENRSQQYEREAVFSDVATAVADVCLGFAKNFNQAYQAHKEKLGVSCESFYAKVKCTELPVSEGVVQRSAERAAQLQDQLGYEPWEVLRGYRVLSLDGNHLPESEKRLEPLREVYDAPLPGTVVARFDHQRQLFDRVYLLEDAHAQESSVQDRVLADLQPNDLLLADRHHCVLRFLRGIHDAGAAFVIRQHGRFQGVLVGNRKKIGNLSSGVVYEQQIRTSDDPEAFVMRRITIVRKTPTQKGETEVHLLTNLPPAMDALTIAELYPVRWEEETGFCYLTTTLTCEVKSIGHPRAALFLFCMAILAFNVRQIVFAALYAEHEDEQVNEVSHFKISVEVSRYTDGMLAIIDEAMWEAIVPSRPEALGQLMRRVAAKIDIQAYQKSRRGPKKKKEPVPKPKRKRTHVSTAKILAQAKA